MIIAVAIATIVENNLQLERLWRSIVITLSPLVIRIAAVFCYWSIRWPVPSHMAQSDDYSDVD